MLSFRLLLLLLMPVGLTKASGVFCNFIQYISIQKLHLNYYAREISQTFVCVAPLFCRRCIATLRIPPRVPKNAPVDKSSSHSWCLHTERSTPTSHKNFWYLKVPCTRFFDFTCFYANKWSILLARHLLAFRLNPINWGLTSIGVLGQPHL